MGFNATVVVMVDALHDIKDDPKFGANLAAAIMRLSVVPYGTHIDVAAGNHGNAATVIESHHADGVSVVLVGGNSGFDVGHVGGYRRLSMDKEDRRMILRAFADQLGFDVAIKEPAIKDRRSVTKWEK